MRFGKPENLRWPLKAIWGELMILLSNDLKSGFGAWKYGDMVASRQEHLNLVLFIRT